MTLISFTTTQISAFRIAFEAIESLISDVLLVFTTEGIYIRDIDKTGNLLVSAIFDGNKFDTYSYDNNGSPKFKLGVSIDTIVKAVKTNLSYDVLTCEISSSAKASPSMTITLTSTKRDEKKICPIKLTEVLSSNNDIQPMVYGTMVEINPTVFSKYIKDLNHVSESVILNLSSDQLELCGTTNNKTTVNTTVVYRLKNNGVVKITTDENIIQTKTISVKRLLLLNKCVNLSPNLTICMSNDKPLVFILPMASLGDLNLLYV